MNRRILTLLALLSSPVMFAAPAAACSGSMCVLCDCNPGCRCCNGILTPLGDGLVEFRQPGLTAHTTPGLAASCGIAYSTFGDATPIAASYVPGGAQLTQPFAGQSFLFDDAAIAAAQGANCSSAFDAGSVSFIAETPPDFAADQPADIVVLLQLAPGQTLDELAETLSASTIAFGQFDLSSELPVGSASDAPSGTCQDGLAEHFHVLEMGPVVVAKPSCPSSASSPTSRSVAALEASIFERGARTR